MTELIRIEPSHIGGEAIQTCNARDLHAFLEVKARFNDWIRNRVEDFGFQQNPPGALAPDGAGRNGG